MDMKIRLSQLFMILCLLFVTFKSDSQEIDTTANSLFNLSFPDFMNTEIDSAVRQSQNITNAPSIVSVITENKIKERGYLNHGEFDMGINKEFFEILHY